MSLRYLACATQTRPPHAPALLEAQCIYAHCEHVGRGAVVKRRIGRVVDVPAKGCVARLPVTDPDAVQEVVTRAINSIKVEPNGLPLPGRVNGKSLAVPLQRGGDGVKRMQ